MIIGNKSRKLIARSLKKTIICPDINGVRPCNEKSWEDQSFFWQFISNDPISEDRVRQILNEWFVDVTLVKFVKEYKVSDYQYTIRVEFGENAALKFKPLD